MSVQIKKIEFLPFDEWYKKRHYYKERIGMYEVEIQKDFGYYVVSYNFSSNNIDWVKFDDELELESIKAWYEEACSKANEDFENYIRTHHLVEE